MPAPVSHMIGEKYIQNFGQKSEDRVLRRIFETEEE
jgi:hypothetical protein